jgi:3',5'-cyclic AMP phosphodiesterase CpdA
MKKFLLILLFLTSFAHANELKFVQISDSHYMRQGKNTNYKLIGESPELLNDAVNQVNEIDDLSFVIFTGDMADIPSESELRGFLDYANKIKVPTYYSIGNHDVGKSLTRERFCELTGLPATYYSFVPQKGFKVIVLDAVDQNLTGKTNGFIDPVQLEWLDEQISTAPNDIILIFLHHPISEPFLSKTHKITNAYEVESILRKHKNPTAVFSGHYHACKIKQSGNIVHISSPSLVTYPNAFRVITVENNRKNVVFDIDMKETGLKNLQKSAKMFVGSALNAGDEKDQKCKCEIEKRK